MKTLSYIGGSLCLPDDTADAVLAFSLALARRRLTDIVTLDSGEPGITASTILLVGHGMPLAIRDDTVGRPEADDVAELERRIEDLAWHSTAAARGERELEPIGGGYDADLDLEFDRFDL